MDSLAAHLFVLIELTLTILLALVHDDISTSDGLVGAVVVDHILNTRCVFPPDADAESVQAAIASPQHELVGVAVGVEPIVDRAFALELGYVASSHRI